MFPFCVGIVSPGVWVQPYHLLRPSEGDPGGQQVWTSHQFSFLFTSKCILASHYEAGARIKDKKMQTAIKILSHKYFLNSDGEEVSTADNFNDIYYSLKYEADLLFTRFVQFSHNSGC